jgi:hypothetical protein
MIVGPAKTADKHNNLKVLQASAAVNQRIDVDRPRFGPGKLKSIGGFSVTV